MGDPLKSGPINPKDIRHVVHFNHNYSGIQNYIKNLLKFETLANYSEDGVAKRTFKIKKVGDSDYKVMRFFEKTTNEGEPDYFYNSLTTESEFIVPCIEKGKLCNHNRKNGICHNLYITTFPYYELTLAKLLECKNPDKNENEPYQKIERTRVINYGYCVAKAIQVFHNKNGIHRTVHPDNIMILDDERALLMHSEFYKELKEALTDSAGTTQLKYKPPDMLVQKNIKLKYGPSVDVWAFGLVMNQMLIGKFPFEFSIPLSKFQENICRYVQSISDWGSSDDKIKQLIYLCLKLNPIERISIDEVVILLEELKNDFNNSDDFTYWLETDISYYI